MDKMAQYEAGKKEIQKLNLPPKEYEAAIKELCGRLGI
jgi:hypothetical protein